ncbi:SPOR domain-containing protein [Alcaligenaceae bacterium CGII-47]|nr:SPOR domain-containing protein [Alcaligenaceae bacterium CGII-47]
MFFRNATDSAAGRRPATRSASSTEAQLKEMRNKARRRLIGALALVLAAVIIVPPLFDRTPPVEQHELIVVPAAPSGLPGIEPTEQGAMGGISTDETDAMAGTAPQPDATTPDSQTAGSAAPTDMAVNTQATPPSVTSGPVATEPAPPPKVEKPSPSAPARDPDAAKRTDDGSVALALLAGKIPSTPSQKPNVSSTQGNFVLQVAAYTTEQDANQRRDKLIESGVTNAYVERAQSGDKTVFRLRVGPFTSHDAAQASQTRLRALGYQNGLISSK